MHPPLTLHKHPQCAEIIKHFKKCHEDHPVTKYLGACNDLKIQLDRCFRQEKAEKRRRNFEASKAFQEKLKASKASGAPRWSEVQEKNRPEAAP
eukprot:jgi/Mesen1/404/ME000010S_10856